MCSFKNKKPSCLCSVCRGEIMTVTSVSLAMPSTSRQSFRSNTHSANNNFGVLQPREPAAARTISLRFPEIRSLNTQSCRAVEKPVELEQGGISDLPLIKSDPSSYAHLFGPVRPFNTHQAPPIST